MGRGQPLNALSTISSRDLYGLSRTGSASRLDRLSSGAAEEVVQRDSTVSIELTTVLPPRTGVLPRFQADEVVAQENARESQNQGVRP